MAAKSSKSAPVRSHLATPKKRRAGRHSKKKSSKSKTSKYYKKPYRGQGK